MQARNNDKPVQDGRVGRGQPQHHTDFLLVKGGETQLVRLAPCLVEEVASVQPHPQPREVG